MSPKLLTATKTLLAILLFCCFLTLPYVVGKIATLYIISTGNDLFSGKWGVVGGWFAWIFLPLVLSVITYRFYRSFALPVIVASTLFSIGSFAVLLIAYLD